MKYKEKESEGEEEENEGEREEEIRPKERASKSPKKGEDCFLILLYLGCIYEQKCDWVINILEEYQYL